MVRTNETSVANRKFYSKGVITFSLMLKTACSVLSFVQLSEQVRIIGALLYKKKYFHTSGHPTVCSTVPGLCFEDSISHTSFNPIA